jgi:hypothetical protein
VLAIAVIFLVMAGITAAAAYEYQSITTPPPQPIAFPHDLHAQRAQLDCQFCHRTADTANSAGLPAVEQCIFCHQVVARNDPEIQRLIAYWETQTPIDWERVHHLPDHVRFMHSAHIQAGVSCQTCHGNVEQMSTVRPVRPFSMDDCVDCHRANDAPTDCAYCHH